MANLYADENVPARLVAKLQKLGHDVLTALQDGRANQSIDDDDVLSRATTLVRCVLTNNRRHFHKLHKSEPDHNGILTFTTDPDIEALATRIHDALSEHDDITGKLVRVVKPES